MYVLQYLLMPIIARNFMLAKLLGNSLYLAGWGYYFVITFLGYNSELLIHEKVNVQMSQK